MQKDIFDRLIAERAKNLSHTNISEIQEVADDFVEHFEFVVCVQNDLNLDFSAKIPFSTYLDRFLTTNKFRTKLNVLECKRIAANCNAN